MDAFEDGFGGAPAEDEAREVVRLLVESAAGIAPRDGDLKAVRRLRFTRPGIDRARWSEIAAMGWLGLRLPEAQGGTGLGSAAPISPARSGRRSCPSP